MKHDRHVSTSACRKAAFTPCRDECGDEGRSAAENFIGALVAPINAAERRNFAGGKERWMGERSGGGAGRAGFWGKPVLRLAGLSAGRKSGAGRVKFRRDGRAHKRSREPAGAD